MKKFVHRIDVVAGARPESSSLVFVSTDAHRTPGGLNKSVQQSVGVLFPVDPLLLASQGYKIEKRPREPLLVWIVTTSGNGNTAAQLNRNLRRARPGVLEQLLSSENGSKIWIPLMGARAGGIDPEESARKTLEAFRDVLSGDDYPEQKVVISLPPNSKQESIEQVWQVVRSERYENTWAPNLNSKPDKTENAQETGFGLKFQRRSRKSSSTQPAHFVDILYRSGGPLQRGYSHANDTKSYN